MDRLRERVEQELEAAAAAGRQVSDLELSEQLAAEFCAECGQAEIRAAVMSVMQRRLTHRTRAFPKARGKGQWR